MSERSSRRVSAGFLSSDYEPPAKPTGRTRTLAKPDDANTLNAFSAYFEASSRPKSPLSTSPVIDRTPFYTSATQTRDVLDKVAEPTEPTNVKTNTTSAVRRALPSRIATNTETVEGLKAELEIVKKSRLALLRLDKQLHTEMQELKTKEEALNEKIAQGVRRLAMKTALYKATVNSKQQVTVQRDDAIYEQGSLRIKIGELEKEAKELKEKNIMSEKALASKANELLAVEAKSDQLRTLYGTKSEEAKVLEKKLQDREEQRDALVRQVEHLMGVMEKMNNQKEACVKSARMARDNAATHEKAVNKMLKDLDHHVATGGVQIGRLKEEVKTLCGQKLTSTMQHGKEAALLGAEIERLLLDNAELKDEVKLYKEDCGVVVLD